jgi:hypothetical protein
MPHAWRASALLAPFALLAGTVSGCFGPSHAPSDSADQTPPQLGVCRLLTAHDVSQPSNDTAPVSCDQPHTAQTYAVGQLPADLAHASYDGADVASYAYRVCSQRFQSYTGADESLAMRTVLSWAWFRPTEAAWKAGARWYRCDVVGGGDQTRTYVDLPARTKGLLSGRPKDEWMVCAQGASVSGSVKVPCSQQHDWRAVTTIVLGGPDDPYPGDRVVQRRTRDYCSTSVSAWLDYPVDYDFGYSWFHEAEWQAGNRRSVCWARSAS